MYCRLDGVLKIVRSTLVAWGLEYNFYYCTAVLSARHSLMSHVRRLRLSPIAIRPPTTSWIVIRVRAVTLQTPLSSFHAPRAHPHRPDRRKNTYVPVMGSHGIQCGSDPLLYILLVIRHHIKLRKHHLISCDAPVLRGSQNCSKCRVSSERVSEGAR